MSDEKKYEVTDELRKKYPDIEITINRASMKAQGVQDLFIDKLLEILPTMNKAVKDMSIIEAEYMIDKTGLADMFTGMYGMEDADRYVRMEAYKVAVEKNKERALGQYLEHWNKFAAAAQAAQSESPNI